MPQGRRLIRTVLALVAAGSIGMPLFAAAAGDEVLQKIVIVAPARRPHAADVSGGTGRLVVASVARVERAGRQPDGPRRAARQDSRPVLPRLCGVRAAVARAGMPAARQPLCVRGPRRAHQDHGAGAARRHRARLRLRVPQQAGCDRRRPLPSDRGRHVPAGCADRADRDPFARGRRPQQRDAGFQGACRCAAGRHGLLQAGIVRGVWQAGRMQARQPAHGTVADTEWQGHRDARRARHRVDRGGDFPAPVRRGNGREPGRVGTPERRRRCCRRFACIPRRST